MNEPGSDKTCIHLRAEPVIRKVTECWAQFTEERLEIQIPGRMVAILEQREVERVGRQMAAEQGLTYNPSKVGEVVSGRLTGFAKLVSSAGALPRSKMGWVFSW